MGEFNTYCCVTLTPIVPRQKVKVLEIARVAIPDINLLNLEIVPEIVSSIRSGVYTGYGTAKVGPLVLPCGIGRAVLVCREAWEFCAAYRDPWLEEVLARLERLYLFDPKLRFSLKEWKNLIRLYHFCSCNTINPFGTPSVGQGQSIMKKELKAWTALRKSIINKLPIYE